MLRHQNGIVAEAYPFGLEHLTHQIRRGEVPAAAQLTVPVDDTMTGDRHILHHTIESISYDAGGAGGSQMARDGAVRSNPSGRYLAHHMVDPFEKISRQWHLETTPDRDLLSEFRYVCRHWGHYQTVGIQNDMRTPPQSTYTYSRYVP